MLSQPALTISMIPASDYHEPSALRGIVSRLTRNLKDALTGSSVMSRDRYDISGFEMQQWNEVSIQL